MPGGDKIVPRIYAGILGPLAFLTTIARQAMHGGASESILLAASCSLWLFALLGCIVGRLAGWIVEESVEATISSELAAQEAAQSRDDADAASEAKDRKQPASLR